MLDITNHWVNIKGESRVLAQYILKDRPIFFDVGACLGEWATMAKTLFPLSIIHSFEINHLLFDELSKNVSELNHVFVNKFGLADSNSGKEMSFHPYHKACATLINNPNQIKAGFNKILVRVISGDDYCIENDISQIDYLKIDTEGAEHLVLSGFKRMVRANKINCIQFEYGTINKTTGILMKWFYDFLAPFNYKIGKILPKNVEFDNYYNLIDDNGSNFIAIRK